MLILGYCTMCRKIKRVHVTIFSIPAFGICPSCEENPRGR